MAKIESSIEALKDKVQDFHFQWQDNYSINYVREYCKAFDNFNMVKVAQDRKDQALLQSKIDLSVTALTICGGSVLAAVIGGIALQKATQKVVLDALCKQNMEEILVRAKLSLWNTPGNKILEFAVGKVGEQIKNIAKQEAKDILEKDLNVSKEQFLIEKPYIKRSIMEHFLAKNFLQTRAACDTLLDTTITSQEKESLYNELKQSNFCNPPKNRVIPSNYSESIELTFYLKHVLSSDWLIQYNDNAYGFHTGYRKTPINAQPGSSGYPSNSTTYNRGFYTRATTRVEYDKIGQEYINRMNDLYRKVIPGKRFSKLIDSRMCGERTSRQILNRAYQALKVIGHINRKLIFFPNGGKHMAA